MDGLRLEQLRAERSIKAFVDAMFCHDVLALPAVTRLPDTFGIVDFERLLWTHEESLPARLCSLRSDVERPMPRRSGGEYFRWAIDEFRDGSVLSFAGLHEVHPYFLPIAGDLTEAAQAHVAVEAALLPAGTAFAPRERAATFVLQSTGYARLVAAGRALDLAGGDAVYVAGGVDCSVVAVDGPALAILVTFRPSTRRHFLDMLAEIVAEEDECSRRGVVNTCSGSAVLTDTKARLLERGAHPRIRRKAVERLTLSRVNRLRPAPGHHLAAVAVADRLGPDSQVELPAAMVCALVERGDRVHLYVPGLGVVDERRTEPGGLVFPIAAAALLRALLAKRGPFTARDLPTLYSESARLMVLRRLAWEGALIVREVAP